MATRTLALALLISSSLTALPVAAQPAALRSMVDEAMGNQRNDLEGGIWEYKVIERSGDKATVLVGKIRIKESAAFDVSDSAKGSLLEERATEVGANEEKASDSTPFGLKPPKLPKLGIIDRIAEGNRGGNRIGDINYSRSNNSTNATPKVSFDFDADDEHILTGKANVKYDTRGGGGVWRGTYQERQSNNKKKRWTFELRFIED